jgi:hypothetical protein
MRHPISDYVSDSDFLAKFGEVVMEWNQTEARARKFLFEMIGAKDMSAYILLAHLGNVGITDAIKAYKEIQKPALSEHIEHYCLYFDRLREYRNYYVHGLMLISFDWSKGNPHAVGEIEQFTAKGRLAQTDDKVSIEDLKQLKDWMTELATYSHVVRAEFNPQTRPKGLIPLTPQRKPPLPDRLQKTRRFPLGAVPQAPSPSS